MNEPFYNFSSVDIVKLLKNIDERIEGKDEERNDVYIYKTLRYPPTSQPPEEDK